MGDADAVKSTALGVKNLQRVAKMLMSATAWKEGETYDDLAELYGRMVEPVEHGDEPRGAASSAGSTARRRWSGRKAASSA